MVYFKMQYNTRIPFLSAFLCLTSQIQNVLANTEKVIFLGPGTLNVPMEHPTLEDLHLDALSPQHHSLRTHIQAEFPAEDSKYGQATWYLLQRLKAGQRYEVRICWAATVRYVPHVPEIEFWIMLMNLNQSRNQPHFDSILMI